MSTHWHLVVKRKAGKIKITLAIGCSSLTLGIKQSGEYLAAGKVCSFMSLFTDRQVIVIVLRRKTVHKCCAWTLWLFVLRHDFWVNKTQSHRNAMRAGGRQRKRSALWIGQTWVLSVLWDSILFLGGLFDIDVALCLCESVRLWHDSEILLASRLWTLKAWNVLRFALDTTHTHTHTHLCSSLIDCVFSRESRVLSYIWLINSNFCLSVCLSVSLSLSVCMCVCQSVSLSTSVCQNYICYKEHS